MLPHLLSTVPSNALRSLSQTFTKDFVCMLYKSNIFLFFSVKRSCSHSRRLGTQKHMQSFIVFITKQYLVIRLYISYSYHVFVLLDKPPGNFHLSHGCQTQYQTQAVFCFRSCVDCSAPVDSGFVHNF